MDRLCKTVGMGNVQCAVNIKVLGEGGRGRMINEEPGRAMQKRGGSGGGGYIGRQVAQLHSFFPSPFALRPSPMRSEQFHQRLIRTRPSKKDVGGRSATTLRQRTAAWPQEASLRQALSEKRNLPGFAQAEKHKAREVCEVWHESLLGGLLFPDQGACSRYSSPSVVRNPLPFFQWRARDPTHYA
jgi:hypothetical protein